MSTIMQVVKAKSNIMNYSGSSNDEGRLRMEG